MSKTKSICVVAVFALAVFAGCGGEPFSDTSVPDSGTGGTAGQAGAGGTGGTAGSGGFAGSSGTGGAGGEAGDAGVDSDIPDSAGGSSGSSGTGGVAGSSGSGGDAGPDADADVPDGPNEADADTPDADAAPDVEAGPDGPPPNIHAEPYQFAADQNLQPGSGPTSSVHYYVQGAGPGNVLTSVSVTSNMSGNFSVPQSTPAVGNARVRCLKADMSGYNNYEAPMVAGMALFTGMECYHQSGGNMDFWVQVYIAANAPAGAKCRVALNPLSITVQGDTSQVPVFTVVP